MSDRAAYQIQVQGWMDRRWAGMFGELAVIHEQTAEGTPITTLRGCVADQAALRGILSRLWDLNLTLVSVARLPAGYAVAGQPGEGASGNE